jgi:hypothetical protein
MYRFYSPPGNDNRVTVVGTVENNTLKIAVAICSKKDRFVRKIGRTIAEGRLKKDILYETVEVTDNFTTKEFVRRAGNIANIVSATKKVSQDS